MRRVLAWLIAPSLRCELAQALDHIERLRSEAEAYELMARTLAEQLRETWQEREAFRAAVERADRDAHMRSAL
jgi:ribosomal protein S3